MPSLDDTRVISRATAGEIIPNSRILDVRINNDTGLGVCYEIAIGSESSGIRWRILPAELYHRWIWSENGPPLIRAKSEPLANTFVRATVDIVIANDRAGIIAAGAGPGIEKYSSERATQPWISGRIVIVSNAIHFNHAPWAFSEHNVDIRII